MKYANPAKKTKVVATRAGQSIEFPGMVDGKPVFVHVPPQARFEVREQGMLPEDEAGFNEEEAAAKKAKEAAGATPDDPAVLKQAVYIAFDQMVAADDAKLFTAGGLPKADALKKLVGFDVDNGQRTDLWASYQQMRKESSDPS